jgi:hypothetical protein
VNSSQLDDKDTELLPEGEKSFGYGDAVNRILALEREVAGLRSRLEEISAGTLTRPAESFGTASHRPPPPADMGPVLEAEPSLPFGPAESGHSAAAPHDLRPLPPPEWDPRRKVECPECGKAISADSLSRHRRRVHSDASPAQGGGT